MSEKAAPPYLKVLSRFRGMIDVGELKPGDHLPSVRDIARTFGIAHATAAKVVALLKAEGYVTTSTGATGGTVVAVKGRPPADCVHTIAATGEISTQGDCARITFAALVPAPQVPAAALGVEPGDMIIRRNRVGYSSEDVPLSASVSYLDGALAETCPGLLAAELVRNGPSGYVAQRTGRQLGGTKVQLTAEAATATQSAELGIAPGSPVMIGRSWVYDVDGEVIEYGESCSVQGCWLTYAACTGTSTVSVPAAAEWTTNAVGNWSAVM